MTVLTLTFAGCGDDGGGPLHLDVTTRSDSGTATTAAVEVDPARVGIVVVDTWDSHWDPAAAARVDALIPSLNAALADARTRGMTVFIATADIPVSKIATSASQRADTSATLPAPIEAFPGTGFFWPAAPHIPYFSVDPNQHQQPPGVERPRLPTWTGIHPDLRLDGRDVVIDAERWDLDHTPAAWDLTSTRELITAARARGVTHLIYAGVHSNWSVISKNFGMTTMKRAGFRVYLARDLTDAFSGNGIAWEANPPAPDRSVTPDWGNRITWTFVEQWFDGTVDSASWARSRETTYAATVKRTPGLLAYWRLDGGRGPLAFLDEQRFEAAWQEPVRATACAGAVGGAACFTGGGGVAAGPPYREDLPATSRLRTLNSGAFAIEAWVRLDPAAADGPMWILSHTDGTRTDVAFGVIAGRLAARSRDGGTRVSGGTALKPGAWYHVALVQLAGGGELRLYVGGKQDGSAAVRGEPVALDTPLLIGAQGRVAVANGGPGEARDGHLIEAGWEGFRGAIDELAIYEQAVTPDVLRAHARAGRP